MKWLYCLVVSAFVSSIWLAHAHDFWIEADTTETAPGASVSVFAKTGHGVDQSNWPIVPHRITSLRSIGPEGVKDHQSAIASAVQTGVFEFSELSEGAHILAIESGNSFSELPAETFDSYVEEEGVLPIARDRETLNRANRPGKELYSRRGKTLVQVGSNTDAAPHLTKPIGMTLEITPLQNPFSLSSGASVHVQVRYRGQPINGATLHVTKLDEPDFTTTLRTSSNGIAEMPSISDGRWLFHTVWSSSAAGLLGDADYITVFSSITFDIGDLSE